jgi:methylenetetrahydrofolate dehydrogenase (NAD+)
MSTTLPSAPYLPSAALPPQATPHTACKTILAATIATSLLSEVREGLSKLKETPHLVGILANDDPAAKLYAEWTRKTCEAK